MRYWPLANGVSARGRVRRVGCVGVIPCSQSCLRC